MKLFSKDKVTRTRNMRRLRFGTASTVFTIAAIVIVLLLNIVMDIIADRYPITWDMSSDKVFSLSEESIEIATNIKNEVEIVVFTSEEAFTDPTTGTSAGIPEFDTTMREFYNALRQYRTRSGDKVTFQFIDPNQEPAKFAAYKDYDVSAGDILFISGDRHKVCSVGDLYELDDSAYYTYGTYTFSSKVEKVMGSNIYSLQSDNDRIVQVLVGHEEDAYTIAGLKSLYELNGYTFEEINITASSEFNKDAEVMLIAAPAKDYTDTEIRRVREWVYNKGSYGRHLIVYTNATADCPNLYELLQVEYGIEVTDQLVLETDLNRVQNYSAYFPMCDVASTQYTANSVCTGKICTPIARRLITSWPSVSEHENAISKLGHPLTSYPESARLIKLQDYTKQKEDSSYAAEDSEYPLTTMIAAVINTYNNNTQQKAYGTIVVSGCPVMAYSDYIQNGSLNNEELLLDTINSVTGHENSVSISNKIIETDTVNFDTNTQLILGIGVFTVGMPVIVLILCLVIFLRRKNL